MSAATNPSPSLPAHDEISFAPNQEAAFELIKGKLSGMEWFGGKTLSSFVDLGDQEGKTSTFALSEAPECYPHGYLVLAASVPSEGGEPSFTAFGVTQEHSTTGAATIWRATSEVDPSSPPLTAAIWAMHESNVRDFEKTSIAKNLGSTVTTLLDNLKASQVSQHSQ